MPPATTEKRKSRDAERSRETLLQAAEESFAERGFAGASLGEIAKAAGLSRGTPNYFFGSKDGLYVATLERAFAAREKAAHQACAPLCRWAERGQGVPPLEQPLRKAVTGYLEFLLERPSFVTLVLREELDGGARLAGVRRESRAIEEAFEAVRAVAGERELKSFDPRQAVLIFVSLTFSPISQRSTFMASLGIDFANPSSRRRHINLVVDQLLRLTRPD